MVWQAISGSIWTANTEDEGLSSGARFADQVSTLQRQVEEPLGCQYQELGAPVPSTGERSPDR